MTKDIVEFEQLLVNFYGADGIDYGLRFAHGADVKAKIELRDGDHSLIGTGSGEGSTNHLKFGSGTADVWLTGDTAWENVKVEGGKGSHHVLIEDVGSDGVEVKLADGNSAIVLGTSHGDSKSSISGGNGDFSVMTNGLGALSLGHGSHVVRTGEIGSLTVGDGDSQIALDAGNEVGRSIIKTGDGDHRIAIDAVANEASVDVNLGAGNSITHLGGSHTFTASKIKGGFGNHTVFVEAAEGLNIELGHGDQTVSVASVDGGKASIKLGDGDHKVLIATDAKDTESEVSVGTGNSHIAVGGAKKIKLKDGDHVVHAGDVQEVELGEGSALIEMGNAEKISIDKGAHKLRTGEIGEFKAKDGDHTLVFNEGGDKSGAEIKLEGKGDDVVIGVRNSSKAEAKIETHKGDDHIALLNGKWKAGEVNGGDGYDVLYLEEGSGTEDAIKIKDIEEIVFVAKGTTAEDLLAAFERDGDAAAVQIADALELESAEAVRELDVPEQAAPDVPTFELVPTPDPQGLGAAVELVYGDDPLNDLDGASREDRLMESPDIFFLRVESYELTFQATPNPLFEEVPGYNEFGDLAGTNAGDELADTLGSSYIFAMAGDDVVDGGDGDDAIYGGSGDDVIRGGDGQDLLDGGAGSDVLIGGEGIDIFVFRKGEGLTDIADFELSYDILDVEGFGGQLTYEALTNSGQQVGDDVVYTLGDDTLILRDVELETMVEIDLCIK